MEVGADGSDDSAVTDVPSVAGQDVRLSVDGAKILVARILRTFGFGYLAIVLAIFLDEMGLSAVVVGAFIAAAIAGSAVMTVAWSFWADRFGRGRTLVVLSLLMATAGLVLAITDAVWLMFLTALTGGLAVNSGDSGPANSVDQAILPQTVSSHRRTTVFAWYNMCGNFAGAGGALMVAGATTFFTDLGLDGPAAYRPFFVLYAVTGVVSALLLSTLSADVEMVQVDRPTTIARINRSRSVVVKMCSLYGLDAFAGGFILQSLLAYWFVLRWDLSLQALGVMFFWQGVLSGISFLAAGPIARRIGLVNTMVFTHVPANLMLILLPLAPSAGIAVALLLLRAPLSQMDVPTRQSYTMAIVGPDERTAVAGVTNVARTAASAVSPAVAGYAFGAAALGMPFFVAGGLKLIYDFLMYREFRSIRPPEEQAR